PEQQSTFARKGGELFDALVRGYDRLLTVVLNHQKLTLLVALALVSEAEVDVDEDDDVDEDVDEDVDADEAVLVDDDAELLLP
ncbi:hypothetical protein, partial [Pantoea agglomerans]|uniref:hypothetical protein n=1 Tax=Enterobacter agglomerans TaxID=549 RepID=UPI003C7E1759